ncbi:S8 family serine peptidase [bacterium]|nr:S8 family serine peptidase [bacterium]
MSNLRNLFLLSLGVIATHGEDSFASSLHEKAQGQSVPQSLIVKMKRNTSVWGLNAQLATMSLDSRSVGAISEVEALHGALDQGATKLLRFAAGLTSKEAAKKLQSSGLVEWAQPNYYLSIFKTEEELNGSVELFRGFDILKNGFDILQTANPPFQSPIDEPAENLGDPLMGELWGLERTRANLAWEAQPGSRDIIVADIDTGVDYNHEDLNQNMWEGVGYDFADKDAFPFDGHGHGTHTSGTIAGVGGNGIGVSGVAQKASIMAVRFIGDQGYGTTADAILSIDYAVANGARVLSNSWGGTPEEDDSLNIALKESIERAAEADVLFVAAAGNDGADNDSRPLYPAAYDVENIITVAATNDRDRRSFFSNYGAESVDLGAPGSNILSAVPGNKYQKNSGTSMACPHVAGLAALILAERPELTALEVKEIILSTVDPFPALQGITVTGGLMNVQAALEGARQFDR